MDDVAAEVSPPTELVVTTDGTSGKRKRLKVVIPERVRTQLRRLSESLGDPSEISEDIDSHLDLDLSARTPLASPGITNFRMKFTGREPESKVLVLYTGGTIGMQSHNGVYVPEPGYLGEAIREDPHLNEESYIYRFFKHEAVKPFALP
ncbi:unnamed protein product [Soboliphyme baturini]|uniref:Asparaginase n=1 Tax=Soboliphyme baturini TaxID=241478 RepID=A0A183J2C4_9BILA|nr:unnamed protein product [Soboliphyme baturini]